MIIVVPLSGALYRIGTSMAVIAACACRHPTATSLASSFLVTTTTLTTSALALLLRLLALLPFPSCSRRENSVLLPILYYISYRHGA